MKSDKVYRNKNFQRPFARGMPIHVTMQSEKAVGPWSMASRENARWMRECLPGLCRRLGIILMQWSNNGNHLHMLIRTQERSAFLALLRALPGRIARKILGAEKARGSGIKFWTERPYSRVVSWGRELKSVSAYIQRNVWEACGKIAYQPRGKRVSSELQAALVGAVEGRKGPVGQLRFF